MKRRSVRLVLACFLSLFLFFFFVHQVNSGDRQSRKIDLFRKKFWRTSAKICKCSCGIINRRGPRLIGGKTTEINEYPWAVALLYKGHYFCGGTLINQRYVLTAAHCVRGVNKSKVKVLVGDHVRSFPIETPIKYYDVVHIVYHHLFNASTFDNDIGLVKVKGYVEFQRHARPACLPSPGIDYVGKLATATGWGKQGEEEYIADSLQEISIPVLPNVLCKTKMRYEPHEITDNMICAGFVNGGIDSCHGDSGGGLIWEGKDGKADVIGIVSWGHGCGREKLPGLYTKIANYLPWIAHHTRDTCFCGRRHPRTVF